MQICGLGSGALDFIDDKILMLFGASAGNGVEEYSVRITMPQIKKSIEAGCVMHFGKNTYKVTAIGDEAMETLRLLGHCTLRFDGSDVPVLPGTIHLDDADMPEIVIGDTIDFYM